MRAFFIEKGVNRVFGTRKAWTPVLPLVAALAWPVSALALDPAPSPVQAMPVWKVLFIGNSYTKNNGLPTMFGDMVRKSGILLARVEVRQVTIPEWTLEMHWAKGGARQLIESERWDYVVLQEQSTRPLVAPNRMQESVGRFAGALKSVGAQGVLLTTWSGASEPETQARINSTYLEQGKQFGLSVAPVGIAWAQAVARMGTKPLYSSDGRHPSKAGTFLAACTLYHHLFRDDKSCSVPDGLDLDSTILDALDQAAMAAIQGAP